MREMNADIRKKQILRTGKCWLWETLIWLAASLAGLAVLLLMQEWPNPLSDMKSFGINYLLLVMLMFMVERLVWMRLYLPVYLTLGATRREEFFGLLWAKILSAAFLGVLVTVMLRIGGFFTVKELLVLFLTAALAEAAAISAGEGAAWLCRKVKWLGIGFMILMCAGMGGLMGYAAAYSGGQAEWILDWILSGRLWPAAVIAIGLIWLISVLTWREMRSLEGGEAFYGTES